MPNQQGAFNDAVLEEIAIANISPDPDQPRKQLEDIDALAASIREVGVLQPPIVRPLIESDSMTFDNYIIIAGERRWTAAKLAGLTHIACLVREVDDPMDILSIQMVENIQKDEMNIDETAAGLHRMRLHLKSGKAVARKVGISETEVSKYNRVYIGGEFTQKLSKVSKDLTAIAAFAGLEKASPARARNLYKKLEKMGFEQIRGIIFTSKARKRVAAKKAQQKDLEKAQSKTMNLISLPSRISSVSSFEVSKDRKLGQVVTVVVDQKSYVFAVSDKLGKVTIK